MFELLMFEGVQSGEVRVCTPCYRRFHQTITMFAAGRFLQRYYVLNVLGMASYGALRMFKTSRGVTGADSWLGLTKEGNVLLLYLFLLASKYRSSATIDEFVGKAIMFGKLAILVLLWYLDVRLMVWYSLFFLGMYRPRGCCGYGCWGGVAVGHTPRFPRGGGWRLSYVSHCGTS